MKTFLWLTACLVALPLYAADRDPGPADRYPTTSITTNVAAATSGSRGQTFYGSAVPPNGLPAEKVTERVTIEDVDASDDTITFMDEDGHRRMVAAENHALLKDLHRGDPIDITYTPWLLVGVD